MLKFNGNNITNVLFNGKVVDKVIYNGNVVFSKSEPRLPDDYQEVEYIESTGTQRIQTNFVPTNNTKVEQEIEFTRFDTGKGFQMSGRYEVNSKAFQFGVDNNGLIKSNIYGATYTSPAITTLNEKHKYTAIAKDGISEFYFDDELKLSDSYTFSSINTTLCVFNRHSTNSEYNHATAQYAKLYSMKIYDNDVLVRNFIPCYRKEDNVIGLYDIANNIFYTNEGTGVFIKGDDVL